MNQTMEFSQVKKFKFVRASRTEDNMERSCARSEKAPELASDQFYSKSGIQQGYFEDEEELTDAELTLFAANYDASLPSPLTTNTEPGEKPVAQENMAKSRLAQTGAKSEGKSAAFLGNWLQRMSISDTHSSCQESAHPGSTSRQSLNSAKHESQSDIQDQTQDKLLQDSREMINKPDLLDSRTDDTTREARSLLKLPELRRGDTQGLTPQLNQAQDFAPDLAKNLALNFSPGVNFTPDLAPDRAPELAPDGAPDLAADRAPDVAPDGAPELTPDRGPDVAPGCWDKDSISSTLELVGSEAKVYFDLETAGLAADVEILQIAAVCGGSSFNKYITPVRRIPRSASTVTGITCRKCVVRLNWRPVPSAPIRTVLKQFISWLDNIGACILIAHNVKFDSQRISYHVHAQNLGDQFTRSVRGYADSIPIFKLYYPDLPSYKQETLVQHILEKSYDAHNAVADVNTLKQLMDTIPVTKEELILHGYSARSAIQTVALKVASSDNLNSLQPLVKDKFLSAQMATKIAESGLSLGSIELVYGDGGEERVYDLLSTAKTDGKPRVSKCRKTISKLCQYFTQSQTD